MARNPSGFASYKTDRNDGRRSACPTNSETARRQSPGLGTMDAANWRHTVATGGKASGRTARWVTPPYQGQGEERYTPPILRNEAICNVGKIGVK
jgi:hypothetical protein